MKKQLLRINEVRGKYRDCQTPADKPMLAKAVRVEQWKDRTHALGYVFPDSPGRQKIKGSRP